MRRLNVRCCCDPNIIFGTLPWNENGSVVRFQELISYYSPTDYNMPTKIKTIDLEVAVYNFGGYRELAYKSNDLPIETFRKLPGFKEGDVA